MLVLVLVLMILILILILILLVLLKSLPAATRLQAQRKGPSQQAERRCCCGGGSAGAEPAVLGHGWPVTACPRNSAGVKEPSSQSEAAVWQGKDLLLTFGAVCQK
ncbi:hypothetical protein CJF40_13495 [Pseudomonas lundensis]|uniref:Uncharacterized protein n=1 Tax=Pseudomonas lundensis TaxID=86185 RepID=A0ABX4GPE4_9PSED|nr:hypothetical protein CJF40_13495 [Pseudomonas lundensis]OZY55942.1 hypothetical protein CJF38_05775 [Pseudomonas lundensis]